MQIATLEAVCSAADALLAEGTEPSGMRIRKRIGGGSLETIAPHLQVWKKRRDEAALVAVPIEVLNRGTNLARELYVAALRATETALSAPLQLAQATLKSTEAQLADAEADVVRLEKVEQTLEEDIARLTNRNAELERNLAAQQAITQEKGLAVVRLEAQLEQVLRGLAERETELAVLRASTKATEALQGVVETLQRSVHGLATGKTE
jgi:septal ring factor EnvC (AmiA/AmiB activator)